MFSMSFPNPINSPVILLSSPYSNQDDAVTNDRRLYRFRKRRIVGSVDDDDGSHVERGDVEDFENRSLRNSFAVTIANVKYCYKTFRTFRGTHEWCWCWWWWLGIGKGDARHLCVSLNSSCPIRFVMIRLPDLIGCRWTDREIALTFYIRLGSAGCRK